MLPVISICVSALGAIGYISHLVRKAPEGWEDSTGFHFAEQAAVERTVRIAIPSKPMFQGALTHAASGSIR